MECQMTYAWVPVVGRRVLYDRRKSGLGAGTSALNFAVTATPTTFLSAQLK